MQGSGDHFYSGPQTAGIDQHGQGVSRHGGGAARLHGAAAVHGGRHQDAQARIPNDARQDQAEATRACGGAQGGIKLDDA
ncbi:hypothetical protein ON010_g6129 [Phytophthora cinnamomi]|nr:hypothetical protein ON010_g6129 [Phytophthora cinnamomi]